MILPKFKATLLGFRKEEWPHYLWDIEINGERFTYKTGSGHATSYWKGRVHHYDPRWSLPRNKKPERECIAVPEREEWVHVPQLRVVLECLHSDYQAGCLSFQDFCSEFGYNHDSINDLNTYRSCEEIVPKLRKALGAEIHNLSKWLEEQNA